MSFHTCKHVQCASVLEITYSAILVCELRLGSAYLHALSLAPTKLCISLVMASTAICKVTPFSSFSFQAAKLRGRRSDRIYHGPTMRHPDMYSESLQDMSGYNMAAYYPQFSSLSCVHACVQS